MNNDENQYLTASEQNIQKQPVEHTNSQTTHTAQAEKGANNYGNNLMPKTIDELREIHARGRKLIMKRKYPKRSRGGLPEEIQKTEEELRLERIQKKKDIEEYASQIVYSNYYFDDVHEYKHVVLPKNLAKWLPKPSRLLEPAEWIELGVYQTSGWEHYMIYAPEPHVLLFRREKNYLAKYGDTEPQVPESMKEQHIKQSQEYIKEQKQKQKEAEKRAAAKLAKASEDQNISNIPPQEHIANHRMTRSSAVPRNRQSDLE